jgi:hypothetical protein
MKVYGGVDVQIHVFLTSALVGCEWSASRPGRLTLRQIASGTHWTGGWVWPQSQSGRCGAETNLLPLPGIEPWPSSRYPVAMSNELS